MVGPNESSRVGLSYKRVGSSRVESFYASYNMSRVELNFESSYKIIMRVESSQVRSHDYFLKWKFFKND